MAIAAGTHFGPWSEEDLVGLPEAARGYELLEGTLLGNPPPGGQHQAVSWLLTGLLRAAAGPELMVVEAMGVRLPGNTMLIPDVVVARRGIVLANTSGILDPADITLVAEVVSPGSRTMDRLTKPVLYAGAGIPAFWRVELEDGPIILAYALQQGRYVEAGTAHPGERLTLSEPFPISIDPADLQP